MCKRSRDSRHPRCFLTGRAAVIIAFMSLTHGVVISAPPAPSTPSPEKLAVSGAGVPRAAVIATGTNAYRLGDIQISTASHTLTFPAAFNLTDAVVEYALVTRDGKTHESLLSTAVPAKDLHLAALLLGAQPESNLGRTNQPAAVPIGARLKVWVEWTSPGEATNRVRRLEELMGLGTRSSSAITGRLDIATWSYTGSLVHEGRFVAEEEGSIIALIRDPAALVNNPGADRDDDDIHYPNSPLLPPRGTPVLVRWEFTPR